MNTVYKLPIHKSQSRDRHTQHHEDHRHIYLGHLSTPSFLSHTWIVVFSSRDRLLLFADSILESTWVPSATVSRWRGKRQLEPWVTKFALLVKKRTTCRSIRSRRE